MRPLAETTDPDPPLLTRTDASRASSIQSSVRSKPYFSLSRWRGGSLSSHLPSSEIAGIAENPNTRTATRVRKVKVPRATGDGGMIVDRDFACGLAPGDAVRRTRQRQR